MEAKLSKSKSFAIFQALSTNNLLGREKLFSKPVYLQKKLISFAC